MQRMMQMQLINCFSSDAVSDVAAIKNKKIVTIGYDEFMDYGPAVFDALSKIADSVK